MQIVNQPGVHRTMRKALLSIVILGALLLGALPAQAASRYEWSDPEGDATGLGSGGSLAAVEHVTMRMTPNDPQFDITKVAVSSRNGVFTYAASVKALSAGKPSGSTGYFFVLAFTYAGTDYSFVVSENFYDTNEFRLWKDDVGCIYLICPTPWPRLRSGVDIPCGGCTGVIDRKKNQVIVTAPIASLTAATEGMRAGSKLTGLYVLSMRRVGYSSLTSDKAAAPKGVAFKL
jgi:hypothetical protein